MGYILNKLGNLPIDDDVEKYIFILKPSYHDDLSSKVIENFPNIAEEIGDNAIIAAGTKENIWIDEVGSTYLGPDFKYYKSLLPALLITDSHPERVTEESERILIPLTRVDKLYDSNWSMFFVLLAEYARGENAILKEKLQPKADVFDKANKIFSIQPSFLGISINFNEILSSIVSDVRTNIEPPLILR